MGLDFVPAITGGMGPNLAHKTLESQFRLSLLTENDAFFIIEVLWFQIVISVNEDKIRKGIRSILSDLKAEERRNLSKLLCLKRHKGDPFALSTPVNKLRCSNEDQSEISATSKRRGNWNSREGPSWPDGTISAFKPKDFRPEGAKPDSTKDPHFCRPGGRYVGCQGSNVLQCGVEILREGARSGVVLVT
ncbi:hypothetical protein AVEN_156597-1 [Araneus ventricosus]|uniref:Uncharacterized protein n=1 Tax=Araneus ventricosus TaxID=182803 RepID=A0A4Y2ETI3_ARAVE|nr:hypothetical protein AVEN_156597-1 [Araneus ventricosus]